MEGLEPNILINSIAGPFGAMLLLAGVLYGLAKLAVRAMDIIGTHLTNIEKLFGQSKDELRNLNERVHDIGNTLDKHIAIVDTRLGNLENRLERLEERRHYEVRN